MFFRAAPGPKWASSPLPSPVPWRHVAPLVGQAPERPHIQRKVAGVVGHQPPIGARTLRDNGRSDVVRCAAKWSQADDLGRPVHVPNVRW